LPITVTGVSNICSPLGSGPGWRQDSPATVTGRRLERDHAYRDLWTKRAGVDN